MPDRLDAVFGAKNEDKVYLALISFFMRSTPVVFWTMSKMEPAMANTSPVTLAAPMSLSPLDTIVIFLASARGPETIAKQNSDHGCR